MQGTSTLQLILHSGLFVKVILVILMGLSIVSWAIIAQKFRAFAAASKQSREFLKSLEGGASEIELDKAATVRPASPFAGVFRAARQAKSHGREAARAAARRAQAEEIERLESSLTFLATTGSTAPFIGLLGTVWGIMDAFRGIGAAGSASLAVVSPAIAEALITTAAGLLAAIPAAAAYNVFLDQIRKVGTALDDFTGALVDRVSGGPIHR
jgi:biopolymer transport protein TolQ